MQFAHETYRVFLFAFCVLCGNIVLNFSGRSRSGVGKLAQLLLSARCVIHPVSIETETPTIFTISSVLPVSPFVSFSIVGLMIKVNKERSNFCATSWAKREKRGKFIWNCAVVPSYSLAIYAKRFVCPEVVIANSYLVISAVRFLSRSAMFATRRVIWGCNTTVYALHSIFDLNEDNENEEKFFKNLPLLANPVYSKC